MENFEKTTSPDDEADAPTGLRGRKKARRREEIIAAASALFARHGIDATSMADIANEVGISQPTVFNYFGSKDGILIALIAEGTTAARQMDRNLPRLTGADLPTLIINLFMRVSRRTLEVGGKRIWLFLITIPFWTNMLVRTIAVQEMIRNEGLINSCLMWLGVIDKPIHMMFSDFAILLGMTYIFLPLMVLPVYSAIEKFDFGLVEAAHDLYATRFYCVRRVILPLIKPGIIAGSILVFVPSLGAYVIPRILGGGKNLMLGNLIELQFGQGRNWPLGAALSITLMIMILVAMVWYTRVTSSEEKQNG